MNTPTLMQSEEEYAPWNEKTKSVIVNISQTLSSIKKIEVPENFNNDDLEEFVKEQIRLPSNVMYETEDYDWIIDDFCVVL